AATSNQMFRRIDDFLSMHDIETPVRLLHSTAWLVDKFSPARDPELDADGELARQWFEPQRRGLLSPWAVGTVDQAMMAALKIKYQFLRLLGLSSKVLIIDEAHAYDVYMTTILERLLSWCSVLQIPVIILSATLPADKRRSLMQAYAGHITAPGLVSSGKDYPQLTHVDLSGNITERTICTVHGQNVVDVDIWPGALGDWERVADRAVLMAGKGGCICVIVNTVKEAQQLYKIVSERADETIWVRLFHSRYCVGDRLEIERVCLKAFGKTSLLAEQRGGNSSRPAKAILIATQVVEQSLDLDFDAMITALAPIDLILQRMGRMHRHEGRKRPPDYAKPVLTVLSPHDGGDLGPSAYVYEPWLLRKTLEILRHYEHISTANDIRPLIEKVYSEIPAPNHQNYDDWAEMINKIEDDKNKARVYLLPQPNKDQFTLSMIQEKFADPEASSEWFRARTRQGDDNCQVILLDPADFSHIGDKAYMISLDQAKKIMLSMVNIPAYWLANTSPAEGFTAMVEGTGRLSGRNLLEIREGRWEGQDSSKRGVNLIYDKIFGARLERK
ncbi:MAG: CRISPR-associated helicase Cas3', partial [Syntrophomonadaceae bacterium]|nr:CRISPR-associated helicase Cas3' [Syntrophomonadaceae bacterium]